MSYKSCIFVLQNNLTRCTGLPMSIANVLVHHLLVHPGKSVIFWCTPVSASCFGAYWLLHHILVHISVHILVHQVVSACATVTRIRCGPHTVGVSSDMLLRFRDP